MNDFYANVLPSSRYSGQRQEIPFQVSIEPCEDGYWVKGGIGGQYTLVDMEFFIKVDNQFVRIDPFVRNTPALLERILTPMGVKNEWGSEWLGDVATLLRKHASKIIKISKLNEKREAEEYENEEE